MKCCGILLIALLAPPVLADSTNILGSWSSNCYPLPKRHTVQTSLEISESLIAVESALFAENEKCGTKNLIVTYTAKYKIGAKTDSNYLFNYNPHTVTMTLLRQDIVDLYNQDLQRSCGLSNWRINEPRDVSGLICAGNKMPTNGEEVYDLMGMEGSSLRFAAFTTSSGATDDLNRPSTLNQLVVFISE